MLVSSKLDGRAVHVNKSFHSDSMRTKARESFARKIVVVNGCKVNGSNAFGKGMPTSITDSGYITHVNSAALSQE